MREGRFELLLDVLSEMGLFFALVNGGKRERRTLLMTSFMVV